MKREPDFVVGTDDKPYMLRWYLVPRNRFFNVYLNKFIGNDEDRALHDHPWASLSIILNGGYFEIKQASDGTFTRRWYGRGSVIYRGAKFTHRIELLNGKTPCTTLFLTGPKIREWGFHCDKGWTHWKNFVDQGCP